jgi:hypothetical protein
METIEDCINLIKWYKDLIARSKYPKMINVYEEKLQTLYKRKRELKKGQKTLI